MDITMTEHMCVNTKKEAVHRLVDEPREFNVDFVISRMKKVGHRDSDGYLVLPKYYDDE